MDKYDEGWVPGWEREAGGRPLASGEVGTESPVSSVSLSLGEEKAGGLDSSIGGRRGWGCRFLGLKEEGAGDWTQGWREGQRALALLCLKRTDGQLDSWGVRVGGGEKGGRN